MQVKKSVNGDYHLLAPQGKLLGGPEAQVIMEEIQPLLDGDKKKLILNLSGIERMNSSGLGVLISVFTSFKKNGGIIKIAGARDSIRKLFEITKLDKVFELYDNEADALKE